MNLTKEQLEQLERMGYMLITPELAAINMEIDEVLFRMELKEPKSPVRNAYYRGYLKQLLETREAITKAAHNGSNPAQLELMKLIKSFTLSLNHG